jgi:hypothetical protein
MGSQQEMGILTSVGISHQGPTEKSNPENVNAHFTRILPRPPDPQDYQNGDTFPFQSNQIMKKSTRRILPELPAKLRKDLKDQHHLCPRDRCCGKAHLNTSETAVTELSTKEGD